MANDFFDKYKAKGGEDLETIATQAPPQEVAPVAPAAEMGDSALIQGTQGGETAVTAQAASAPVGETSAPAFQFTERANNGFVAPVRTTTPAAVAAQQTKTIAGIPVLYLGLGALALVLIGLLIFWFSRPTALPDMQGWSISEVELWTNENKVNLRAEEVYSDEISSGNVLSQTPAANERVGKGEFLTVTVSKGPDLSIMVDVPDLMNMSMTEIEVWADANFMTTVRMTTQTSDTVPSGSVISFSVNDNTVIGDQVRRDTPLYVIVSKGKGVGEAIKVPNFLTMSVSEAEAFAAENELILVQEEAFSETVAKGNIMQQDIKADETVYAGETITIVVSTGVEIIVPDFYSLSREMATAKAAQLGIQLIVEERYATVAKDTLLSQSIKSGTLYQEDDILVLQYSKGNSFMITSFVGQSETDVYAWRDALNEEGAAIQVTVNYTESSAVYGIVLDQSHENVSVGIDAHLYFIASAGQPVIVPNFVQPAGKDYDQIITKADVLSQCDALGIVAVFVEESASGRKPGEVWYQSVAAGQEIIAGQPLVIKIVPLSDASTVSVPSFTGKTLAEVSATTNASKLTLRYQDTSGASLSASDIGATDVVKSQSVAANSKVTAGYEVVLVMQAVAAPTPDTYSVPNYVGKEYSEISATENFAMFVLKYQDSTGKEITPEATQTVASQSEAAYSSVTANTLIILTMNDMSAATNNLEDGTGKADETT